MAERYEVQGPVVIDHTTTRVWEAEAHPDLTWAQAMALPDRLNAERFGGYADWRLPPIEKLIALVDFGRVDPASEFPGMPGGRFWASSSYAGYPSLAWYVSFYDGNVNYDDKANTNYARCVRGGPGTTETLEVRRSDPGGPT